MKPSIPHSRSLETPAIQASAARSHQVRSVDTGHLGPITSGDEDVDRILSSLSALAAERTPLLPDTMERDVRQLFEMSERAEADSASAASARVTVPAPVRTAVAQRQECVTVPVPRRTAAKQPSSVDSDDRQACGDRDTDEDLLTFDEDIDEERALDVESAPGSPYTNSGRSDRASEAESPAAPSDDATDDDDLRVCERMMFPLSPPPLPTELRRRSSPPPLPRSQERAGSMTGAPAIPSVAAAPSPMDPDSRAIIVYAISEAEQSSRALPIRGNPDTPTPAPAIVRLPPPAPPKSRRWVGVAVGVAMGVASALFVAAKEPGIQRALPVSDAAVAMARGPVAAIEEPRPKAPPASTVRSPDASARRTAPDTNPARRPASRATPPPAAAPAAVKAAAPVIAAGPSLNGRLLGDEEE